MDSPRRTSIATGALFIIATVAAVAAAALDPSAVAALLYLIAAGSSVGIAIAMYPLLRPINAGLALGSVVFRTIEAVFYTAAVVFLLSSVAPMGPLAETLLSLRQYSTLVAVFAFTVGALMYYTLFYRARLVPRWLSGWGLAATLLMMTACLLALFTDRPVTGYTFLFLPIAVQEMVLAGWLLVKGFSPRASDRHLLTIA